MKKIILLLATIFLLTSCNDSSQGLTDTTKTTEKNDNDIIETIKSTEYELVGKQIHTNYVDNVGKDRIADFRFMSKFGDINIIEENEHTMEFTAFIEHLSYYSDDLITIEYDKDKGELISYTDDFLVEHKTPFELEIFYDNFETVIYADGIELKTIDFNKDTVKEFYIVRKHAMLLNSYGFAVYAVMNDGTELENAIETTFSEEENKWTFIHDDNFFILKS